MEALRTSSAGSTWTGWSSPASCWLTVKLRLGKRLLRQVKTKEAWWAENRPGAPDLFAWEFQDTLERIRSAPGSGIGWPTPACPKLRRILMPWALTLPLPWRGRLAWDGKLLGALTRIRTASASRRPPPSRLRRPPTNLRGVPGAFAARASRRWTNTPLCDRAVTIGLESQPGQ